MLSKSCCKVVKKFQKAVKKLSKSGPYYQLHQRQRVEGNLCGQSQLGSLQHLQAKSSGEPLRLLAKRRQKVVPWAEERTAMTRKTSRGSTGRTRRKKILFNLLRNKRRVPRRASKALGSRKTKRKNNRQKSRSRNHKNKYRPQQWRKNAT
jgi:hypothetical protein